MLYSEASYFDDYAFAHIAAWEDHQRIQRKRAEARERWRKDMKRRLHNVR